MTPVYSLYFCIVLFTRFNKLNDDDDEYFIQNIITVQFWLILPKFGCHDNALCSLENSDSIFDSTYPKPYHVHKNCQYIAYTTEISAILVCLCLILVAMSTPLPLSRM